MKSYQLLRISVVCYSLSHSELLPEQSLLDKLLKEIGGKINKAGKTCEKLMILMEKTKIMKE